MQWESGLVGKLYALRGFVEANAYLFRTRPDLYAAYLRAKREGRIRYRLDREDTWQAADAIDWEAKVIWIDCEECVGLEASQWLNAGADVECGLLSDGSLLAHSVERINGADYDPAVALYGMPEHPLYKNLGRGTSGIFLRCRADSPKEV